MIRPFGETRELVSLNECGAERSANSFLLPAWIAFRRRQSPVAHARIVFRPFGCKESTVSRQPNVLILPVQRPGSRPSGTLRSEPRLARFFFMLQGDSDGIPKRAA